MTARIYKPAKTAMIAANQSPYALRAASPAAPGSNTADSGSRSRVASMNAGDAWLQPPSIKHKVHHYSDDCEVLEIVMPADFKTVELEK